MVQYQGRTEFQTTGILTYVEDLKRGSNTEIGPKDIFEIASKNVARSIRQETVRSIFKSGLYCITSEEHSNGKDNIEMVRQMIGAGIKIIQYREKEKPVLEKLDQCRKIRELTREADALFIVNDNVDIALAVNADGVHVGQDDMPVDQVRKLVGNDKVIGLSTHTPAQANQAVALGADYIGVGPIFKTTTKKDVCNPVGFQYLEYVVKHIRLPFVAIGGIKEHNLAEIVKRGGFCAAMITEIVGAENIDHKIQKMKTMIQGNNHGI